MPKIPKGFNARAKPYIKAFFTLPQITRINTDFSFLKNICEYLWNLRENNYMLLER